MSKEPEIVLAIDPGRDKCGLALVDRHAGVLHREVIPAENLQMRTAELCRGLILRAVVLGDRTGSASAERTLRGIDILQAVPMAKVDEHMSSEEARRRYWQDHSPQGWRKLLPTSLQVPPRPYDDYVAVILAERYFRG